MRRRLLASVTASTIKRATQYGSQLDAGLLSSKYPFQPSLATEEGTRIEAP